MTDLPYTDEDLRAEAARQYYISTTDPDFMGIGEQMDGAQIASRYQGDDDADGITWDEALTREEFGTAQRAIDDLLGKAADVSEWAVDLGADGLTPVEHSITVGTPDDPQIRIHFAFAASQTPEQQAAFVNAIAHRIGDCPTCGTTDADAPGGRDNVDPKAVLADLAGRWERMGKHEEAAIPLLEGPAGEQVGAEIAQRAATYRKAAADLREVLVTGRIPHDLMTDAELGG